MASTYLINSVVKDNSDFQMLASASGSSLLHTTSIAKNTAQNPVKNTQRYTLLNILQLLP